MSEPAAKRKKMSGDGKVLAHGGQPASLSAERMAELKATAQALSTPGKGFLAADESAGPWTRAGHAEAAKVPDTAENRAMYRSACFRTPGLNKYISGTILHWETLFQTDAAGNKMTDLLAAQGILAGV
jgi:fructose-bisphosphate aldolase class I